MRIQITEEMKVQDEWYKEARDMTLDKLPEFLNRIMNDYSHDYGTICHAIAAGAIATTWAMDHSEQGGITGFQAGAVMWQFIRNWNYSHNKTGLKIIDFDKFLYPQYGDYFQKTISPETWAAIQKEAAAKTKEADEAHEKYLKDLAQYEIDIVEFALKYPDYIERPEHYQHLSYGTGEEWGKYEDKKSSGFEFAPREPYDPMPDSRVYHHWQSIINDVVPFGYKVVAE